ncbi:WXG100 family type VII secretion target [Amycolatopsis sp. H20-H5]|uniref:WXG100 family type VII secretion target n=1 Tax=Amycolatopsis sp. H20-H5 TaxID=3046309 RepID=UPI002DBBBA73|nr:WXG100 family type VII secretion target [Amycolatopsis sp. H20-H5]MEC3975223.1 WXG100 family type VII secretion target [Amycolatopsis sp. H20-H5]
MADNFVSVTTPGMQQAAVLFENASSESSGHMKSINENQAQLMATWRGDASVKFGQAMNDWENQFSVIVKELNHMIETMGVNAKAYAENEQTAEGIAGQWAGGLSGL